MKKFMALFILLGCVILGSLGCPSKNPVSPLSVANSPTPVNTATNTPTRTTSGTPTKTSTTTPTATPSNTATNSPTSTVSNTATNSGTPTASGTPTNTASNTATATPSSTATNTATSTASATPCQAASFQATYSFNNGIQCWAPTTGSAYVTDWTISSTHTAPSGNDSLVATINNTSGSNQSVQLQLIFSTPQNMTGYDIVAYVYIDPTLAAPASSYTTGLQGPFDESTGSNIFESPWNNVGSGTGATNVGAWFPVTLVVGSSGGTASSVNSIGIQLTNMPAGATGNLYLADVSIFIPAGPTATPTTVPNYSWTFEDGSTDGFYVDYNTGDTITPNSYANLGISNASGGVSALDMTMISGAGGGNDMQIESNYVSVSGSNGFPINFSAIGAVGVRIQVYVMPDAAGSSGFGAANYVKTTSGDVYGTGGVGTEIPGGYSYTSLTSGAWTQVSLQPSGTNWATDETSVTGIGIELNVYGGTQATAGDYIIDNMQLY